MPTHGEVTSASLQAATAETAKMAPTDRSKTPAMMPMVTPQATIQTGADWSRILSRLRWVRNRSVARLKVTKSARKLRTIP